jgi:hypothetical protein
MIINLEKLECINLIKNNYIGYLGYIYKDRPFVVPITYYFDEMSHSIIGYSTQGHKTKALRIHPFTSLEVVEIESINKWKSVLVQGTYKELSGSHSKSKLHTFSTGIKDLIKKKEERETTSIGDFSSKIYNDDMPVVFEIHIDALIGKQRNHTCYSL